MSWETVRPDQLSTEEPKRANQGHAFIHISRQIAWPTYCRHCGHVPLKNDISRLVTRIGCNYEDDERFKRWQRVKTL